MSRINMHNTHDSQQFLALHDALLDIIGVMNRPQIDQVIIDSAGISLDRALFTVLIVINRRGPIGVVDLAERLGRDYTTLSRQVAKLEQLGLVARAPSASDRRVNEASPTAAGRAMNAAINQAREDILRETFRGWKGAELRDLVRLVRRFADDLVR